jgi:uncharacterized protein (DUF1800 family)
MDASAIALNRFGLGARADETAPADAKAWLLDQFARYQSQPQAWAGHASGAAQLAAYQHNLRALRDTSERGEALRRQRREEARAEYLSAVACRTRAALETPAPFVERLVHFWANHFALSVDKFAVLNQAGAFEADAIRPHVLGRFEDMLLAVVRHPGMLLFLDQANSIGPDSIAGRRLAERNPLRQRGLNENLAREILELHTLGVRSGYGQADVSEFARALTGFSVVGDAASPAAAALLGDAIANRIGNGQGFLFRPALHEPGRRTVLGRTYDGAGENQALAILHDLAVHPATARHVAAKLARHFIADDPPDAAVQRLAAAFQRSGGDLPTVYRALVDSPEAWASAPAKFKSPWDWAVSGLRGLGLHDIEGARMAGLMNQLGQPLWRPGSPAGYDDVAATWAAPDALMRRVETAQRIARQASATIDARALAPRLLTGGLGATTAEAIARAESPASGLALLLVSPEFLRR